MQVYRDNGKSLYPNSNRYGDMQPVMALNQVIQQEINTLIATKKKNYLSEFDDDCMKENGVEILEDFEREKWDYLPLTLLYI
jgi:hypothetical protein